MANSLGDAILEIGQSFLENSVWIETGGTVVAGVCYYLKKPVQQKQKRYLHMQLLVGCR